MKKFALFAALLAAAALPRARANEPPDAQEVLDKVAGVYSHLSSIRASVKWNESRSARGQSAMSEADYDLTAQGRNYFLRLKENGVEAIVASDGAETWKALVSGKQWSHIEAAAEGGEEEEYAGARRNDLYGSVAAGVFSQYPRLAKSAQDAAIVREADYKLSGAKVPCYVLRLRAGKIDQELWVDKSRFLVLQRIQKIQAGNVATEVRVRTISIELNGKVPDSTFHLQPGKDWSEVEMVLMPGEKEVSLAGSRAANFALKTLDGESAALSQARGKVVLLDFWATWCEPCRKELPLIEKLRAEFGDSLVVYGVNDEDAGAVKDFVKKNRYEMTVLIDGKRQVNRQYGVSAIPTLLIIDREGIIRKFWVGARGEATLRQAIQSVIASK